MSILLSNMHISVLIDAILQYVPGRYVISYIVNYNLDNAKEMEQKLAQNTLISDLGQRLRQANGKALLERKIKTTDDENYQFYPFMYKTHKNYTVPELIKVVRCYAYNSLDAEDWGESSTSKIIMECTSILWKMFEKIEKDENTRIGMVDKADTWCIEDAPLIESIPEYVKYGDALLNPTSCRAD